MFAQQSPLTRLFSGYIFIRNYFQAFFHTAKMNLSEVEIQ